MGLRILAGLLLLIWLVLVIAGKGGFVHLLFFNGIAVLSIDLVSLYRARHSLRSTEESDHHPAA